MSDIKVRVGQQNAIKIISAQAGLGTDLNVNNATNVIGGIASVTTLNAVSYTHLPLPTTQYV